MKQEEVNKVIDTILILLEQEENRFVEDMKKVIGNDLFDRNNY